VINHDHEQEDILLKLRQRGRREEVEGEEMQTMNKEEKEDD